MEQFRYQCLILFLCAVANVQCLQLQHLVELIIVHVVGGGGHVQVMVFMMAGRSGDGA